MNKISVFDKLATRSTVENTNGIVLDSILLSANVEEDLEKDSYILTAEFSTLDNLYKEVKEKSILKVKLDYGYDYFVVKNIDYDEFNKSIDVIARHITEEAMLGLWINNIAPTNLSGKDAIQWIYDRAIGTKEITFVSDITETMSADYVRMNMQEMLYNTNNGLLTKKATGEVLRRGYTVYIKNKIKFENDLEIRKGKNLTGFSGEEDCSNVVTRVNPISYNAPVTDIYVTSPLADKYKSIITKEIKYDNVRLASDVQDTDENRDNYIICDNEETLRAKLIELATKEFTENEIDKALCEYDISFEDLSTTEEYKDYQQLESASTGEIVKVIVDNLGYNLNARVIKRKYDVANQKIASCTLSNVSKNLKPQGFYDIAISNNNIIQDITDGNSIIAEKIKGYLNSRDVSIRASRKVADKQDYIVAISECLDKDSPLYGAIMWGTGGIYLSTQRTADGKDWDWSTAITSKGITADVIDTGTLRAITITNADASFILDLSKSNGIIFQNEGRNAIQINKNEMSFFGMDGSTKMGYIKAFGNTGGMYFGHNPTGYMMLGASPSEGAMLPYITFDLFNVFDTRHSYPITIEKDTDFRANMCVLYNNKIGFGDLGTAYICKQDATAMLEFYGANGIHFNTNNKNVTVTCNGMGVLGGLTVSGTKNRVVDTEHYGKRLLNAVESADCIFTDMGEATIGENGEVRVEIDKIFLETVDTNRNYQVFTTLYGDGKAYVSERKPDYFIIKGTPNLNVGWEIKAKQKDFVDNRLEEFDWDKFQEKGDR